MKNPATFVLDDYVSPKIIAGPHASEASRTAATALRNDPLYQELTRRLKAIGFFDASPWSFAWRIALLALAYAGAFAWMLAATGPASRAVACCVLGFVYLRGSFIAHDAGHGAITRNQLAVGIIGQLFGSFLGGYSFAYFRRSHDLHHYHCNEIDHDPNTMARLFTLNEESFRDKTAAARLTTRVQHIVIPMLYPLWSFSFRAEGISYVLRNWRKARVDAALLICHFALWFSLPVYYLGWGGAALCYIGSTVFTGIYLGIIIPVNHVGMPTVSPGGPAARSFLLQQVSTSRNTTSSVIRDFLAIGQNSQIEHHLFPWAPGFKLGRGRKIVREFCREYGFPYHECSYTTALLEVQHHFARLARLAAHAPTSAPVECPALHGRDNMLPRPS